MESSSRCRGLGKSVLFGVALASCAKHDAANETSRLQSDASVGAGVSARGADTLDGAIQSSIAASRSAMDGEVIDGGTVTMGNLADGGFGEQEPHAGDAGVRHGRVSVSSNNAVEMTDASVVQGATDGSLGVNPLPSENSPEPSPPIVGLQGDVPVACATADDCETAWGDNACRVNLRCNASTSTCLYDVLDTDHDKNPAPICGGSDCDDANRDIYPGGVELCDGRDNDCDGEVDEQAQCGSAVERCVQGQCVCDEVNLCDGVCVDLMTSAKHCGECGIACAEGQSCVQGQCDCVMGTHACQAQGICADLDTDPLNCGACGNVCPALSVCQAGVCNCRDGLVVCPGSTVCIDLDTTKESCGACGNTCSLDSVCVGGVCECPNGMTRCGDSCRDLPTDKQNCGSCGHTCTDGEVCRDGSCKAGEPIRAVSVGDFRTCAITTSDALWCWGDNFAGGVGDDSYDKRLTPVRVVSMDTDVSSVTVGYYQSCAFKFDGGLWCWGDNLGRVPWLMDPSWTNGTLTTVALEGSVAYGLTPGGEVLRWSAWNPIEAEVHGEGYRDVTSGTTHTCGMQLDDSLWCWGNNDDGQLGLNPSEGSPGQNVDQDVKSVALGRGFTCSMRFDGTLRCWGRTGVLGNATGAASTEPILVDSLGGQVVEVGAGQGHACAILQDGSLWCWGYDNYGALGNGSDGDSLLPAQVEELGNDVVSFDSGGGRTCAVTSNNALWCWGQVVDGSLSVGATSPVRIIVGL